MVFTSKKTKTSTYNWSDICAALVLVFIIAKAKVAKNILDKKVLAAGIPAASITALVLSFLQTKKRK